MNSDMMGDNPLVNTFENSKVLQQNDDSLRCSSDSNSYTKINYYDNDKSAVRENLPKQNLYAPSVEINEVSC